MIRNYYLPFFALIFILYSAYGQSDGSPNIIIITSDGVRWNEIFNGADSKILAESTDNKLSINNYPYSVLNREELMPFFWKNLVPKGNLYGNRKYHNKVKTKNYYQFSYPGYNEMLCGYPDPSVRSNEKIFNKNVTILEWLNRQIPYKDKIAAFTSWEVFSFIFNTPRSNLKVNAGWQPMLNGNLSDKMLQFNRANFLAPKWKGDTRFDDLTWSMAIEYIKTNQPKITFISLDDTDYWAHKSNYKKYLESLFQLDSYLKELFDLIENNDFYKNKTYVLMTTDHGRGQYASNWNKHGILPLRSGDIWFYEYGPTLIAEGEIKKNQTQYLATISNKIREIANNSIQDVIPSFYVQNLDTIPRLMTKLIAR